MAIFTENLFIDSLAIIISLLAVVVAYYKWLLTYWQRKGVYTPPPSIPFGNAGPLVFLKNSIGPEIKNVYDDIKSKGKPYGGFYFFGKPIFIPVDLDLVKNILIKDFNHFTNHVNHVNEEVDPISGHLFAMKGLKWRTLRAKLTPTFTSGKMKMMYSTVLNCSKGLVEVLDKTIEENVPIDIKDTISRFTTDVIGSCAFGLECNSLQNPQSEFRKHGRQIFELTLVESIRRLLMLTAPELLTLFNIRSFNKKLGDFYMNIVEQTVNFREENNVTRKDFMHLLIQLKNNVTIKENDIGELKNENAVNNNNNNKNQMETSLSLNEIAAQAFVFFAAGFETSSTTITFCLYELVQNLKCQEKVRKEINTVLNKHEGKLTYDAIAEMTYMEQCINETLRKYPPVPVHTRECTETYKVPNSDLVLEKGSFVFVPALAIQRDAEYYPNPEKFDPERFSAKNKAGRHAAAWTPFGDGPRICIGLRFGIMETKVGLATLLKNYKFTLNPKTESPLTMDPKAFVLSAHKEFG